MVQIKCLGNGLYSLKNSHIPFGMGFQPPRPYGQRPFEQCFSCAGASLSLLHRPRWPHRSHCSYWSCWSRWSSFTTQGAMWFFQTLFHRWTFVRQPYSWHQCQMSSATYCAHCNIMMPKMQILANLETFMHIRPVHCWNGTRALCSFDLQTIFSCPEQLNRWPCPLVACLLWHH